MKILFAASECVPFIKTGGLADVAGALSTVLAQMGHDVRVMLPMYTSIKEQYVKDARHVLDFEVDLGWRKQYCGIEEVKLNGVTFYLIDNKYYFGRDYIYGMGGDEYERFGFFSRAILNALPLLDFQPEILHCNDWQTGMVPALLKIQYQLLPFFAPIKTIFTIHNLQYQGVFPIPQVKDILSLGDSLFTEDKLECYGCANFLKAGLVYADELTTVSPSYAEEIQTAYYGEHMDGLLRARKEHLSGVLNGIDVEEYNPADDKFIPAHFTAQDMSGKAQCTRMLQEELGLNIDPNKPLIGMIGRLSNQKGLDLVDHIITDLMNEDVQLVVLGMGEPKYVNLFSWAEQRYPGNVVARFKLDLELAHRIYAGADMFLMPSQFEPCGLAQMMALRYGTIPIVRETGGLRDTVLSYNEYNDAGNGFSFFNYNAHDMLFTIRRAVNYYRHNKPLWEKLMKRGMEGDYSWTHSAQVYVALYESILPKVPKQEAPVEEKVEEKPEEQPKAAKKAPAKKTAPAKKAVKAEEATAEEKPAAAKKASAKKKAPAKKKAEAEEAPKAE